MAVGYAAERRGREVKHHGEGSAGLEAARALEQLLLEEDPGRSEGVFQGPITPESDRGQVHEVAQPLAGGPDRRQGGLVRHSGGPWGMSASQGRVWGPFSLQ